MDKFVKDNNCILNSQTNGCFVEEIQKKKKVWLLGKPRFGLYVHEENSSTTNTDAKALTNTQTSTANSNHVANKAKLWHLRLHLPMSKLQILFPEINARAVKTQIICTICPLGKQTRVVYPQSCSKTSKPLELLHIDVWGPFCHLTRLNCSMFITWMILVDSHGFFLSNTNQNYQKCLKILYVTLKIS